MNIHNNYFIWKIKMNTLNNWNQNIDEKLKSSINEIISILLEKWDKYVLLLKNFWVDDLDLIHNIFNGTKIESITQIDENVLRIEYKTKTMYNRYRLLMKSPTKTINLQAPELELQKKYEFSLRYEKGDSHIVGETQWQKCSLDELDKSNDTSWVF